MNAIKHTKHAQERVSELQHISRAWPQDFGAFEEEPSAPKDAPKPPVSCADLKAEVHNTALCIGTSTGPNFATFLNGEPNVPHHIQWPALRIPRLGGGCFGRFRWGECGSLHTLLVYQRLGGCCFGDGRCNVNIRRRCITSWNLCPPSLGTALHKNNPWFRGIFPMQLFSPTELGFFMVVVDVGQPFGYAGQHFMCVAWQSMHLEHKLKLRHMPPNLRYL